MNYWKMEELKLHSESENMALKDAMGSLETSGHCHIGALESLAWVKPQPHLLGISNFLKSGM